MLALLALFTHNHLFWIAALLLALVQFPDFSSPLGSMARSLEKLAGSAPLAETRAPAAGAEATVQEALPSSPAAEIAPGQAVPPKPVPARKMSLAPKDAVSAIP